MRGQKGGTGELRSVRAKDNVEIEYETVGEGPPVALLHGVLTGRFAFSRQRDELLKTHRLILPSFRGHDGTQWVLPDDYGLALSDLDDFIAVLDATGEERVDIVGHSSGGATAFAFACKFPDRVGRLVLIEPTLLRLLAQSDFAKVASHLSTIIEIGEKGDDRKALAVAVAWAGGDAWRRIAEADQKKRLDRMAHMAPIVAPHLQGLLDCDVTVEDVKSLRPPTLLIYGENSIDFESLVSACWRENRPDVAQILVAGAGHNSHAERPDVVTPAIVDFLNRTR